jgi:dephospho-CoA kinase
MILGIIGKIGSGKTTLAQKIQKQGFFEDAEKMRHDLINAMICEADYVGHELLRDAIIKEKLINVFGDVIIEDGAISRKKLAKQVFEDGRKVQLLNAILHPPIRERIVRSVAFARETDSNLILVAALPKSLHIEKMCDTVLKLEIKKDAARERLKIRNPELSDKSFTAVWERQSQEY